MHVHQHPEARRGLSLAPAIELAQCGRGSRVCVDVNPFVRAVCALKSPQHAHAESNPRADRLSELGAGPLSGEPIHASE
jgi:hypothetical protein